MAKNFVQEGRNLHLVVPAGTKSGDPVVVGHIAGVVEIDADPVTNKAVVCTEGVFNLQVQAVDGGGNSAISVGDELYYNDAATPKLNKNNAGVFYGYALAAVAAGATATIPVKLNC